MSDFQSDAHQRREPRAVSPALKLAVVSNRLIGANHYEFCELIDVSQSGACIASRWLDAKLGQKLNLEFYRGLDKFASRGIVTRISAHPNADHYGIVFIYAPHELDGLIESFVREQILNDAQRSITTENHLKRKMGKRVALQNAQICVKKSDSSLPFLLCQVDNISKGGMGFYCSDKLSTTAPFPVSIQISAHPDAAVITGVVHHMSKKFDAYYYGLEFELVSMEFVRLLEQLEDITHL
ncbi:MAG: PilZ domain-containing protein [Rhodoferax sp.]|nr:PilZ domain-containing protein [Rhodoferax sp.]